MFSYDGRDLVGAKVRKTFGGVPYFGKVTAFDEDYGYFWVDYEDGDNEEMEYEELCAVLWNPKKRQKDVSRRDTNTLRPKKLVECETKKTVTISTSEDPLSDASNEPDSEKGIKYDGGDCVVKNKRMKVQRNKAEGKLNLQKGKLAKKKRSRKGKVKYIKKGIFDLERNAKIPPLPESSADFFLDSSLAVANLFSVYYFLRSFSFEIQLSPFLLEDLLASLRENSPNSLIDSIMMSLLNTLNFQVNKESTVEEKNNFEALREILNWNYLDDLTWPYFTRIYYVFYGNKWPLKNSDDFYELKPDQKLTILQFFCEEALGSPKIRAVLKKRSPKDLEKSGFEGRNGPFNSQEENQNLKGNKDNFLPSLDLEKEKNLQVERTERGENVEENGIFSKAEEVICRDMEISCGLGGENEKRIGRENKEGNSKGKGQKSGPEGQKCKKSPEIENILDGEEIKGESTEDSLCVLCGNEGILHICEECNFSYHSNCVGWQAKKKDQNSQPVVPTVSQNVSHNSAEDLSHNEEWICPECKIKKIQNESKFGFRKIKIRPFLKDHLGRHYWNLLDYLIICEQNDGGIFHVFQNKDFPRLCNYFTKCGPKFNKILKILKNATADGGKIEISKVREKTEETSEKLERNSLEVPQKQPLKKLVSFDGKLVGRNKGKFSKIIQNFMRKRRYSKYFRNFWDLKKESEGQAFQVPRENQEEKFKENYVNFYKLAEIPREISSHILQKKKDENENNSPQNGSKNAIVQVLKKFQGLFDSPEIQKSKKINDETKCDFVKFCGFCETCKSSKSSQENCFLMAHAKGRFKAILRNHLVSSSPNSTLEEQKFEKIALVLLKLESKLDPLLIGPWEIQNWRNFWRNLVSNSRNVHKMKILFLLLVENLRNVAFSSELVKKNEKKLTNFGGTKVEMKLLLEKDKIMENWLRKNMKKRRNSGEIEGDLENGENFRRKSPSPLRRKESIYGQDLDFFWSRKREKKSNLMKLEDLNFQSLFRTARKRSGGITEIPGLIYGEKGHYFPVRSQKIAIISEIEKANSLGALAFQLRDFHSKVNWENLEVIFQVFGSKKKKKERIFVTKKGEIYPKIIEKAHDSTGEFQYLCLKTPEIGRKGKLCAEWISDSSLLLGLIFRYEKKERKQQFSREKEERKSKKVKREHISDQIKEIATD